MPQVCVGQVQHVSPLFLFFSSSSSSSSSAQLFSSTSVQISFSSLLLVSVSLLILRSPTIFLSSFPLSSPLFRCRLLFSLISLTSFIHFPLLFARLTHLPLLSRFPHVSHLSLVFHLSHHSFLTPFSRLLSSVLTLACLLLSLRHNGDRSPVNETVPRALRNFTVVSEAFEN